MTTKVNGLVGTFPSVSSNLSALLVLGQTGQTESTSSFSETNTKVIRAAATLTSSSNSTSHETTASSVGSSSSVQSARAGVDNLHLSYLMIHEREERERRLRQEVMRKDREAADEMRKQKKAKKKAESEEEAKKAGLNPKESEVYCYLTVEMITGKERAVTFAKQAVARGVGDERRVINYVAGAGMSWEEAIGAVKKERAVEEMQWNSWSWEIRINGFPNREKEEEEIMKRAAKVSLEIERSREERRKNKGSRA